MKIKIVFINFFLLIIFYLFVDLIFSHFIFKQSVDHKCYEHTDNGKFYKMRKNCFANMRMISSIDSFKVYTNNDGHRHSGKKKKTKSKNIVFLGDSQIFGVGSNWEDTFVGVLEEKFQSYNFYNLGVPSYSPTVYKYVLEKFYQNKKIYIEKVYVLIDLTDVGDEIRRWQIVNGKPNLKNKKIFAKERTGFSKFKKDNFKGIYLISSKVRSFFRKLKSKNQKDNKNEYRPVEGNPTGGYIYTDHKILTGCNKDKKKNEWWECGDVEKGLIKLEKKIIELSKVVKNLNSEFYIIIMPWPGTLNFGQTVFNWENYAKELCVETKCTKLINLFPEFRDLKNENEEWLKIIYLHNDIHLTKKGNSIIAEKIISESF